MKAVERRRHETLLHTWKGLLEKLNRLGPTSEAHDDLVAYGEVKDYVLDRIEATEAVLHNGKRPRPYLRCRVNSLPLEDNPSDNQQACGGENA